MIHLADSESRFHCRVAAMLVGFAVGDALGAPAAGIRASNYLRQFGPITCFVSNKQHPLLGHLKPGQYTENTRLMLDASVDAFNSGGFALAARLQSLRHWARYVIGEPTAARWPGPTTLAAARSLISNSEPCPKKSRSIGASYRLLPLAAILTGEHLLNAVHQEVLLTHDSDDSLAASYVLALVLSKLLSGEEMQRAITESLDIIHRYFPSNAVLVACRMAIDSGSLTPDSNGRTGTAALACHSLPLALGSALDSAGNFTHAVLKAANSFRGDDVEAPEGCSTEAEELERVNGGNTDGIAALTGCIVGASVGLEGIGEQWKAVEHYEEIVSLARQCPRRD